MTAARDTLRLRNALVTAEVALAMVLLSGCGLLTRSLLHLQSMDPGIEPQGLALVQVRLLPSYDQEGERRAFFRDLQERVAALPGVLAVSYVTDPPMGFSNWAPNLWREEDPPGAEPASSGSAHPVGTEYFRTMGIPVLRGRALTEADDETAPPVVVVSRTLAEALWPDEDPLGKRLDASGRHQGPWRTVVGVVGDIRQQTLASKPARDLYIPYAQHPGDQGLFLAVRTAGDPAPLAGALRSAVWGLDPNVPVPEVTTMQTRVDATLRLPRFRTLLLGAFAGVALLLAAAGIYGTLTYAVGRRTAEVGVRMALGAEAGDVVALVLRQGVGPVLLGVGLGVVGSLGATRLLGSVLFQVSPNDPLTLLAVGALLAGTGLVASFLPARRAARIDPQEALRRD